jgi:hypothetical protein
MGQLTLLLALAALAPAGDGKDAAPPAAAPDIAFCDAQHVASEDDPLPGDPVTIPKALDRVAKASAIELALLTQSGATICDNNVWVSAIANMAWLRTGRLLGWEWQGYEAYGYRIFDRAGMGTVIETGAPPVFSPGGTRFASVEYSESGFGALSGYGVWEVRPDTLAQLGGDATVFEGEGETAQFTEPEVFSGTYGEWSISGWKGETCVGIAMRSEDGSRTPYYAAERAGWRLAPGECP